MLEMLCRLCANNKYEMYNIFDEDGLRKKINFKIQSTLQIRISEDDFLPKCVCVLCLGKLEQFDVFSNNCHTAQIQLQKLYLQSSLTEYRNISLSDKYENTDLQTSFFTEETCDNSMKFECNRKMKVVIPKLSLNFPSVPIQKNSEIHEEYEICKDLDLKLEDDFLKSTENISSHEVIQNNVNKDQIQDAFDVISETKLNEILQNSTLDIPFESDQISVEKNETFTDYIKIVNNKNNINDAGDNMYLSNILTTNLENSKSFKNGSINEANLKKLNAEVFFQNFDKVIENNLKLNFNNLLLQNENTFITDTNRTCEPVRKLKKKILQKSEFTTISDDDEKCDVANNCTSITACNEMPKLKNKLNFNEKKMNELKVVLHPIAYSTVEETDSEKIDQLETSSFTEVSKISNTSKNETCLKKDDEICKNLIVLIPPLNKDFSVYNIKENKDFQNTNTKSRRKNTCEICQLSFRRKLNLNKHVRENHKSNNFRCSLCYYVTTHKYQLNQHMKKKHIKSFICDICGKHLDNKFNLNIHIKKEHVNIVSHKCNFCLATFHEAHLFKQHLITHAEKEKYACNECNLNYKCKRELNVHIRKKHAEKKLKCSLCSYVGSHKYLLNQHHREVHEKRFSCTICGKRFSKNSKLLIHLKDNRKNQFSIKCDYCNLTFTEVCQYKMHLKKHLFHEKWVCPFCKSDFEQKFKLDIHISKHHENYNIKCNLCQFSTSHKYRLKQHVREVHEKKFICDICGKKESKKYKLRVHIKNKHTTKNILRCQLCNAKYRLKFRFEEHMKKHI